jgi:hypothetical protein
MDDICVPLPLTPIKSPDKSGRLQRADTGSDIEVIDTPASPTKSSPAKSPRKGGRGNPQGSSASNNQASAKSKGKRRARTDDIDENDNVLQVATGNMPSDAVFAAWRKGDEDMEPSTKMLGLIDLLNQWDTTGDKTICYSQCMLPFVQGAVKD